MSHGRIKVVAYLNRPLIKVTCANSAVYIDTVGVDRHQLSFQSVAALITIAGIFHLLIAGGFYQIVLVIFDLVKAPITATTRAAVAIKLEDFTVTATLALSTVIKAPVQVDPQITIPLLVVAIVVIAIPPLVKRFFTFGRHLAAISCVDIVHHQLISGGRLPLTGKAGQRLRRETIRLGAPLVIQQINT